MPQMTQLKYFNPKSPVSKTCVPVCDAAPRAVVRAGDEAENKVISPSYHLEETLQLGGRVVLPSLISTQFFITISLHVLF